MGVYVMKMCVCNCVGERVQILCIMGGGGYKLFDISAR